MSLLIGYFLLSIIFSFLCSIWEAVLLSVTPSYIKRMQQEKSASGNLMASLKNDIDRPLSAILTLNTIAHTVGAIGVGAQAGKILGTQSLDLLGFELPYESLIAAVMTLAVLFLSEIIPKTLGANNWKSLAPITARSLKVLILILKPFVWISNLLTRILKKNKKKSVFSKQDFAAMAEVVNESGALELSDYTLIKNLLQFDTLQAKDVMTPRTVIVMAEENQTVRSYYEQSKPLKFSRIPLYHENRDNVKGVLLKDDLLKQMIEGQTDTLLKDIKREGTMVPEDMPLRQAFELLHEKRVHMAIVVDGYGSTIGLLTLEDIIETLFGLEIMDENDDISDLQNYARQKWEVRAKKMGLIE